MYQPLFAWLVPWRGPFQKQALHCSGRSDFCWNSHGSFTFFAVNLQVDRRKVWPAALNLVSHFHSLMFKRAASQRAHP